MSQTVRMNRKRGSVREDGSWPRVMNTPTAEEYTGFELKKLRITGEGPYFTKRGKAVRYLRADLDEWLATLRVKSTSEVTARSMRR